VDTVCRFRRAMRVHRRIDAGRLGTKGQRRSTGRSSTKGPPFFLSLPSSRAGPAWYLSHAIG